MEPETHRLDREALFVNRRAAAERVQRKTNEIVAAAAAKRRAFDDWQFQRMRSLEAAESKRRRVLAGTDTDAAPGLTDDRLRSALQRNKLVRRDESAGEQAPRAAAL